MKKKVMRTFCCILATLFLSVPGIAYAAETGNAPADNVQNCEIQILSTDVEHNRSLARVTTHTANGAKVFILIFRDLSIYGITEFSF